jgi:hypothetical protein
MNGTEPSFVSGDFYEVFEPNVRNLAWHLSDDCRQPIMECTGVESIKGDKLAAVARSGPEWGIDREGVEYGLGGEATKVTVDERRDRTRLC